MPAIRTHNWLEFYESAKKACKRYTFEIVIVSPFDLPDELKGKENITLVMDYGNPSRCTQIANLKATGEFLYNCVDDGVFLEDSIDLALDYFKNNLTDSDVINMRYREAQGRTGGPLPLNFWDAHTHEELRLPGIKPEWKISLHFLMKRSHYLYLGGIDCQFEYSNHGIHDLMFRLQSLGGVIVDSQLEGLNCTHYMGRTGDHAPIHDAQVTHDSPIFKTMYLDPDAAKNRNKLNINNWTKCPEVWKRRFTRKVKSYEELYE